MTDTMSDKAVLRVEDPFGELSCEYCDTTAAWSVTVDRDPHLTTLLCVPHKEWHQLRLATVALESGGYVYCGRCRAVVRFDEVRWLRL